MPQLPTVRRCGADDGIRIRMPSLEGFGLRQSDLRTCRSGDAPGCPGVTVDYPGLLSRRARNGHGVRSSGAASDVCSAG
jgi:hypothetical protein